jgi:hypothetical protein
MTRTEWLTATWPDRLLLHLRLRKRAPVSHRRLRLFACAAVRHLASQLPNFDVAAVSAGVEAWCDEPDNDAELRNARAAVRLLQQRHASPLPISWRWRGHSELQHILYNVPESARPLFLALVCTRLLTTSSRLNLRTRVSGNVSALISRYAIMVGGKDEPEYHVRLLHDIFGPVPHLPALAPGILEWNGGTIPVLARALYQHPVTAQGQLSADRMAILADALEEAGCARDDIRDHLRGPGPHVLGCWVVDQILGKQ